MHFQFTSYPIKTRQYISIQNIQLFIYYEPSKKKSNQPIKLYERQKK